MLNKSFSLPGSVLALSRDSFCSAASGKPQTETIKTFLSKSGEAAVSKTLLV